MRFPGLSLPLSAVLSVCVPSPAARDPEPPAVSEPAPTPLETPAGPTAPEAPTRGCPRATDATVATLTNIHTGECLPVSQDAPSGDDFARLCEDRVTGSRAAMTERLVPLLREVARRERARRKSKGEPDVPLRMEVVSGFRSPKLNEMLRKREHNVASHSQHSLGHALDFRVDGVSPKDLRKLLEEIGWKGGIGQYDKPHDRFVHADVGPNRRWRER